MKLTLRLIGLVGVAVFGTVLMLTFLSPIHVERAARGFIQSEIEGTIGAQLGIVGEGRAAGLAETLAARQGAAVEALRARVASGLDAQIAESVARMQDLGCECRARMLQALDAATELRLSSLERAEPQLRRFVEGRYGEVVAGLLRDLRLFAGTNLLAFLLLLVVSVARPAHVRQLFVPGLLLAVAAVTTSLIYLVGQDWFSTFLYGDFVGLTYGIWLLLIYGFLCDIALFKARITTRIVDVVGGAFGKVAAAC